MHLPASFRPRHALAALALSLLLAPAAQAADAPAVLVSGPAGPVTAAEVEKVADTEMATEQRTAFWSNPASVERLARSLYAQRALAAEAERAGLDTNPKDAGLPLLERNRVRANLWLAAQGKAAQPDEAGIEAYARSEYKINPERYSTPEEVRVRHILLPVAKDGRDDAAVKARAEALLAQLRAGADFAALARQDSADKGSAERGGDLGFFARGRMAPMFERAAFALKQPGDLAGPVRTEFGYHIIELTGRKPAVLQPFDQVLPKLREEILAKADGQERRRIWDAATAAGQADEAAIRALAQRHLAEARKAAEAAAPAAPAETPAKAKP